MRLLGALGVLFAVGVLLAPASALALRTHVFATSFGSAGQGDGKLELGEHSGLAIDETSHDIYVADTGNHRVDQFSAAAAFIRAFGADVGGLGVDICASGCVAGTPGSSPGAFEAPTFIAVDNDPLSLSFKDVYIADIADNLVSKFNDEGNLISSWGVGGQLNGSTATGGPFTEIAGVAVDSAGTLDVFEREPHLLFQFDEAGAFIGEFETPRGTTPAGLAVDPSGNFFKVNGAPSVEKFTGSGADIGQVSASESATGLAVDASNGELYVDNGGSIDNYAFGPFGEVVGSHCTPEPGLGCPPTDTFGTEDLTAGAGLGVDSALETIYAADPGAARIAGFVAVVLPEAITEASSQVDQDSATLHGTVSAAGGPEASCEFQYTTEAAFESEGFEGATSAPCVPPGPFTGSGMEAVSAEVGGLTSATHYRFRVVASNENGSAPKKESKDGALSFFTLGPPVVSGETASAITATGARITGSIDPVGSATSFVVQYVSEADFLESEYTNATSVPSPPKGIGSEPGFIPVTQQLTGLTPGTTYHFRLVATNQVETVPGPDRTFTTFLPAPPALPDGRAYEMVSPPQKAGEVFPPEPNLNIGSSCQFDCLPGTNVPMAPMQSTADGEAIVYEGQPFSGGLAAGPNEYLSNRLQSGWGTQSLSSPLFEFTEGQGYKAFSTDLARGVTYQIEPALSPEAPTREGKSFANLYLREGGALRPLVREEPPQREPGRLSADRFEVVFGGANSGTASSPAFSHVVFAANDALTEEVPGIAPEAPEIEPDQLCRGGENCNLYEWDEGQLRLLNVLPENETTTPGAVIGSRASSEEPPDVDHAISADGSRIFWSDAGGRVFVRIDGEETKKIEDPGNGRFLTASANGSKVLLDDGCLYDLEADACEKDLSEGEGGFQGILGASEDLSRVYFVDTAVLSEEENANEEHAEENEFNLYAWHEGGTITFIGTLLEADNPNVIGAWKPSPTRRTAQVSPDGRYLAFMSQAAMTGYDNNLGGGGQCLRHSETSACNEVFEYDAETGNLTCASCNPGGVQPLGESNLSLMKIEAGNPPPLPAPHNLTPGGHGRLFFESRDTLSPRDTNGAIQDVYEWEPGGVGSCERARGCVFLISSGHASNDSIFLNSTPSGNDVFFVTREQLLPRDEDQRLDIYDARAPHTPGEQVGFPEAETSPCGGEACTGPITSPTAQPSAGSSDFSGPGNVKPHKHKKHHHKKKHKKHHKRSAKHHRGGSK